MGGGPDGAPGSGVGNGGSGATDGAEHGRSDAAGGAESSGTGSGGSGSGSGRGDGSGSGNGTASGGTASGGSADGGDTASGSGDGLGDGSAGPGADGARDERRLSTVSTALLGLFLLADVVFVCGALVTLWPAVLATVEPGADPTATARWSPFGLGDWALTADTAMLLAVVVCSALGSFVHAATSFATYVGNRRLYASWLWWYLLRAGIGVALALLVYLLLRGGLFAGSSGAGATNPYGFSGIAGLCGLFSKQATDKLREICDTLLSTTGDGDRDRRDGLAAARNGDPGTS
ncbi:hypothetical protein OG920_35250 [Streptomyces europaeiscabiei]|uniref:hypothetical protein n=1 Tax=Streptomyces europaeiscabiei TaxID=146819 RepID=UPI0029B9BC47|nr:hypothetical protein [Streptomyces europaeiscabiei]MDX3587935.1 hypothetical protein [Streptomyces europaeiscabiei]MDX3628839.1 hypothetical protein [Streptomyces europaeiscabiei]MDX3646985.1 hypothetical protein [Streptomyces europaeiscabiei]